MSELAFVGAEGTGAYAKGGRGGETIEVTRLDDDGKKGSFRYAVENVNEPRIVIFKVHGHINLEDNIVIDNPYITIDGSSAPKGGITLRRNRLIIRTHDVIIRYMRFRLGDKKVTLKPKVGNSLFIHCKEGADRANCPQNIIIDHCSVSWCMDTNIGIWNANWDDYRPKNNEDKQRIRNITIQWCILSEPLRYSAHPEAQDRSKTGHARNLLIGGGVTNISLHHNLFAHAEDRNAQIKGGKVDFVNNIIYNCSQKTRAGKGPDDPGVDDVQLNYIGNYQIDGKNKKPSRMLVIVGKDKDGSVNNKPHKFFVKGNISPTRKSGKDPQWSVTGCTFSGDSKQIPKTFRAEVPFEMPGHPIKVQWYKQAYEAVLQHAGCSQPGRDAIDQRIIDEVANRKGRIIDSPSEVKGYPSLEDCLAVPDWPDKEQIKNGQEPDLEIPLIDDPEVPGVQKPDLEIPRIDNPENGSKKTDQNIIGRTKPKPGLEWRYFKGLREPSEPISDWRQIEFDDSSWFLGPVGLGYGDDDDATILDDMKGKYTSVFLRRAFEVKDIRGVRSLKLKISYDDGFVAYLNGTEIARRLMGEPRTPVRFDTPATGEHEADGFEEIDLSEFMPLLQNEENVLAVQGHNRRVDSSDFTINPVLEVHEVEIPAVVDDLTAQVKNLQEQIAFLTKELQQVRNDVEPIQNQMIDTEGSVDKMRTFVYGIRDITDGFVEDGEFSFGIGQDE
ncbi:MAG: hypothetical protein AAF485_18085 [Chloroflexota bacterium]